MANHSETKLSFHDWLAGFVRHKREVASQGEPRGESAPPRRFVDDHHCVWELTLTPDGKLAVRSGPIVWNSTVVEWNAWRFLDDVQVS